jgi:hypothetical protein
MNERLEAATGIKAFRFDWTRLPKWLVQRAADQCGVPALAYEGMHVFA